MLFSPSHSAFRLVQPRFVRQCRQACSSGDASEAFSRIPALLVELSVAACQLHAASSSSSAPSALSSAILTPASRPLLTPAALIPLVANCVGECVIPRNFGVLHVSTSIATLTVYMPPLGQRFRHLLNALSFRPWPIDRSYLPSRRMCCPDGTFAEARALDCWPKRRECGWRRYGRSRRRCWCCGMASVDSIMR